MRQDKPISRLRINLWRWGLLAALLLFWELGSRTGLIDAEGRWLYERSDYMYLMD